MRLLVLLLALVPLCALADDWTPTQTAIGAVALAATTVDYGQTRWMAIHCNPQDNTTCGEGNPILGRHPSLGQINAYFITAGIVAFLVANGSTHRSAILSVIAGIEIAVTARNARLGIRMEF